MERKMSRAWIGWLVAVVGYYCWFQAFYNLVRFGTVYPYVDLEGMLMGVVYNFPPILILFLANLVIVFKLIRINSLKLKILTDVVCSFLVMAGVNYCYRLLWGWANSNVDWAGSTLNDVIILLLVEIVFYFNRLSRSLREAEEAKLKVVQYQYDALKAQINPHFLFNSLNLLSSLVSIDAGRSEKFIQELSRMYRYILTQEGKTTVDVGEEYEFLKSYVEVLKMRYYNKFFVAVEGQPAADRQIIPFTMQLLIENVTKHNVVTTKMPMTVTIVFTEKGFAVSNPVHRREAESGSKFGLVYLRKLYLAYGRSFNAEEKEGVFIASVPYL